MNRRDILKALAALPIVGRLVKADMEEKDEWVPVAKPPLGPVKVLPSLPDLCPLCDLRWNEWHEPGGFFKNKGCHHRAVLDHDKWVYNQSAYVEQLRRRREREMDVAYKVDARSARSGIQLTIAVEQLDRANAKIRDIDMVLRYLGEMP